MSEDDKPITVEQLLERIHDRIEGEQHLFRGESRCLDEEKTTTTLARLFEEEVVVEFDDDTHRSGALFAAERENIQEVRKHFPSGATHLEVLTRLQHYGGETNLLDFSRNLYVALYFACSGNTDKPGRLLLLKTAGLPSAGRDRDLYKDGKEEKEPILFDPPLMSEDRRVSVQHSVFLHLPKGTIPVLPASDKPASDKPASGERTLEAISIPSDLKEACLRMLKDRHDIYEGTIYNDFQGHVQSKATKKQAVIDFYRGLAKQTLGDKESTDEAKRSKYYEGAIADYTEAIRINPELAPAYHNRGSAKAKQGDNESTDEAKRSEYYEGAIADYTEAIRINPKDALAYNNRGNAKQALGDKESTDEAKRKYYKEAIADFDRALEIDPKHTLAYYNRGLAKYAQGKYEEAIADYTEAIRINPKDAEAYSNRGTAKAKQGDNEGAIRDYTEAIRINPKYANAYYNRGTAKADQGDYEGALKDWEKAQRLFNEQGRIEDARKVQALIDAFLKEQPTDTASQ